MNFFFDLINDVAGYTHKYYHELTEHIDHEGLIKKYRAEKEKYGENINESALLGDKHPHCLLVMESVQELMRMKGCDNLAKDYLDSVILRL